MKLTASILLLLLMAGCSKTAWLSEDTKVAARQIEAIIPVGTEKEAAEEALIKVGVKSRRLDAIRNKAPAEDYALQGDYTEDGIFTKKRWVITIFLQEDRASRYDVRLHNK
jgi:hypothetical protein